MKTTMCIRRFLTAEICALPAVFVALLVVYSALPQRAHAMVMPERAGLVPQAGGITSVLGFGPEDGLATGDSLYRWDNGSASYEVFTYQSGVGWFRTSPPPTVQMEPELAIGEAFWFNAGGPRNWTRSYSVWP